ncbi:MAG: hypothetical protein ACI4X9_02080 [Kiritimatiellia bacterium]
MRWIALFCLLGIAAFGQTNGVEVACGHWLWGTNGVEVASTAGEGAPVVVEVLPERRKGLSELRWEELRQSLEPLRKGQVRRCVLLLPVEFVLSGDWRSEWRFEEGSNGVLSLLQRELGICYGETLSCLALRVPAATEGMLRQLNQFGELAYEAGLLLILREVDFPSARRPEACGWLRSEGVGFRLRLERH